MFEISQRDYDIGLLIFKTHFRDLWLLDHYKKDGLDLFKSPFWKEHEELFSQMMDIIGVPKDNGYNRDWIFSLRTNCFEAEGEDDLTTEEVCLRSEIKAKVFLDKIIEKLKSESP